MSSMITSTAWVRRGIAAQFPTKQEFDEEEFERIAALAKLELNDAKEELEEVHDGNNSIDAKTQVENGASATNGTGLTNSEPERIDPDDDDLKEYNLDDYDEEEEKDDDGTPMGMFSNIKSLAYHATNDDDPYITLNNEDEDLDEEREELQILATDNLILATKVEEQVAQLEVYVYEDDVDNLYVHHDFMLPDIPLCVEWLDIPVNKLDVDKDSAANFAAIGSMQPDIEIWDLDIVDCMYPNAILGQGGNPEERSKKKKKKKDKKANDEYHVDAVLSLAANRRHRNLLASASADKTVKLWDLHTTKCAKSYKFHTDKVCSLAWHRTQSEVLLSGSYDRTVVVADMRWADTTVPRWGVESDVENVRWDPHDENLFYVSTESGLVHCFDLRNAPSDPSKSKSVWRLQAHDDSVTSLDINPTIPGFLATGSTDKTVKLWNVQPSGPNMVVSRDVGVGKVFSASFAPDPEVSFRLAIAGSSGTLQVWDTSTNPGVRRAFASKVPEIPTGKSEDRLIGIDNDHESESDSGDEDEIIAGNSGNDEDEDDDEQDVDAMEED